MATKKLNLDILIDGEDIRQKLTALTAAHDNDGSSAKVRTQVLDTLKTASKEAREKARELLLKDRDGTACAWRISAVQDEIIRIIFDFAVTHVYRAQNASDAERIAITAVGGYGRGTLAPGSDIDLLFLLPYKQTAWGEQVVEYILYMLWDMGFKVGHATRNLNECIRLSREDMTIRTSILELRFIHGDRSLCDTLSNRYRKEVLSKGTSEFISAKLSERDDRHNRSGESRYLVEPNVKDGKGGLRDLHTLFWIGKYVHNSKTTHGLVEYGMFSEKEYRRFRRAEKFLWTVRCNMHFLTGRAEERLSFDIQREIAGLLGYNKHGGLSGVERFMKHYFLVAREVGNLTLIACAKLEAEHVKQVSGFGRLINTVVGSKRSIRGSNDFLSENGRITIASETVFSDDPVNMIRLFDLAEKHDLDFHPDALELLANSLNLIDREMRKDAKANAIFLRLLCNSKNPERMLRRMNETGFLGKFIPPFGKVVAMMQFNMYHHYTVDEHLIRSVGALWGIETGKLASEHPLLAEILPFVKDRTILYVSLFLHDIAKGRREDHSIAGERVARQLCPRLGLDEQQTKMVAWLIREHLTMSIVAQNRDIADRKTIQDFASVVQEVERMRYLLALTVCDIRAVGPGVWNGWKGQLLRTLYAETELMLNGGFSKVPMDHRVNHAKQELRERLHGWSDDEFSRVTDLFYSPYFLSTDPESQMRGVSLVREAMETRSSLAMHVHTMAFEGITEITVVAQDHPRLLSIVAGACAAAGANIVEAKVHTTRDGRAIDTIAITREYPDDADELRRGHSIEKTIGDALAGNVNLPDIIARSKSRKYRYRAFSVPPIVDINNDLSETFTVIEIECLDRPGLLTELTQEIADLNLDIGSAQIVTFGEKANDSFYVRDLTGGKITNTERMERICDALINVMKPKPASKVSQ